MLVLAASTYVLLVVLGGGVVGRAALVVLPPMSKDGELLHASLSLLDPPIIFIEFERS
jgi:hypothetical protein